MPAVTVLDDQPAGQARLRELVESDPSLWVAAAHPVSAPGPFPNGSAALLALPDAPPARVLEHVTRLSASMPVVVMARWDGAPTVAEVVAAGARGCVPGDAGADAVCTAVRTVVGGGFHLGGELAAQFVDVLWPQADQACMLAPREVETLRWIASGYTQTQIATRMGLAPSTVNTYAKRIRAKLRVGNKAELTRAAVELGYVVPRRSHPAA